MAAVPPFIRCGCHLMLALSYVHHPLQASPSHPKQNRRAAKSGERRGQACGHPRQILRLPRGHLYSSVSVPASPLQTRYKSQPIQRGIENSSPLTTQAFIRMNSESQDRYISSYSERKQTTCKLVGVYTRHGRVHLPTTGGELNKDGSN
jgi:hypothetical protein